MQSLKGKKAIITGAGKGVGKAIAIALAKEGVELGLVARTMTNLPATVTEISKYGVVHSAVADVSNCDEIVKAIQYLQRQLGRVDILINNAGIASMGSTLDMDTAEWEKIFRVNVFGVYYVTKAILPHMIENKAGDIITVASSAGLRANANAGAYSASKFAVIGFMESLMGEVRKHNIRVSTLMPSTIATDMSEELGIVKNGENIMQPEDLAEFVVHELKLDSRVFVKSASLWGTNP